MTDDQFKKTTSLTDLMSEGMEEGGAPALSRRERKALEASQSTNAEEEKAPVALYNTDEPTQQFTPVRVRPAVRPTKAAKHKISREDEDDEEDRAPVRASKKNHRVYVDDEYDDEYDDDYDDYRDDYDDDDDYDDYDDGRGGFGRGLLGFLKALIAVVLILALVVLGLRMLESMEILSLDGIRSTVGQVIPLEAIFPEPEKVSTVPDALPDQSAEVPDVQVPDESSEPANVPAQDAGDASADAQQPAADQTASGDEGFYADDSDVEEWTDPNEST